MPRFLVAPRSRSFWSVAPASQQRVSSTRLPRNSRPSIKASPAKRARPRPPRSRPSSAPRFRINSAMHQLPSSVTNQIPAAKGFDFAKLASANEVGANRPWAIGRWLRSPCAAEHDGQQTLQGDKSPEAAAGDRRGRLDYGLQRTRADRRLGTQQPARQDRSEPLRCTGASTGCSGFAAFGVLPLIFKSDFVRLQVRSRRRSFPGSQGTAAIAPIPPVYCAAHELAIVALGYIAGDPEQLSALPGTDRNRPGRDPRRRRGPGLPRWRARIHLGQRTHAGGVRGPRRRRAGGNREGEADSRRRQLGARCAVTSSPD